MATGYITYHFQNVKQGMYGIRCFQDLNNNNKLDRALFGPSEPWGLSWLSWNENKTFNWPSFNDFSFDVTTDIKNIDVKFNN